MNDLYEKLTKEKETTDWPGLAPHAARQALFLVHADLDLLDVGAALARDDKARVQQWVQAGLVARPSVEKIQAWETDTQRQFVFLIIQPFVLCQESLS